MKNVAVKIMQIIFRPTDFISSGCTHNSGVAGSYNSFYILREFHTGFNIGYRYSLSLQCFGTGPKASGQSTMDLNLRNGERK
jgi:hypothetical protein